MPEKKTPVGTRKLEYVNLTCVINRKCKWTNNNNLCFSQTAKILIGLTVSLDFGLVAYTACNSNYFQQFLLN